jgi:cysteine synthase A
VLGKCEFLNPGGSSKDRIAKRIVEEAEAEGRLGAGGTLVEGSAGSTGVSLSLMARARGYGCRIFIPDDAAAEKSDLLTQFGADVTRVPPASIINEGHYCNRARKEAACTEGAVFADQFENLANFRAHYEGTGPEIWQQCGGRVDAFVMAAGTGGTLAGVARFLKEQTEDAVEVYLVDPPGSSLYGKVTSGVAYAPQQGERVIRTHRYDTITEGIGIDRLTANFLEALPDHNGLKGGVDDAFRGTDQEAVDMAHFLLAQDGLFVGSSSAMNCVGAVRVARKMMKERRERRRRRRRRGTAAGNGGEKGEKREKGEKGEKGAGVAAEGTDTEGDRGRGEGEEKLVIVTILCDSGARHLTKMYNGDYLKSRGLHNPADDDDATSKIRMKPPNVDFIGE